MQIGVMNAGEEIGQVRVMESSMFQKEILDRIRAYRNMQIQDELWELLDSYEKYLGMTGTQDELAEIAFYRGEAYFRAGRYTDTVNELMRSLKMEKTKPYLYLEAQAYNVLGMLFAFVGYETVALENYLQAVSSAEQSDNQYEAIASLMNIGLLYQSMSADRKALHYYNRAFERANRNQLNPDMEMSMLVMAQKAQLFYRMGRFEEALGLYRQVNAYQSALGMEKESILPIQILGIYMEEHFGEKHLAKEKAARIISEVEANSDFMEQIDFYMELCQFLLRHEMLEEAGMLLRELEEKLDLTEFISLRMRVRQLEIVLEKKAENEEKYLLACQHYMELEDEYEVTMQEFRKKNLEHIELLQQIEQRKAELEQKSQLDLATELLNKSTFEAKIRGYLSNKTQDATDVFAMIDIDDFKLVNDTYGHLHGDKVIKALAELMKEFFADRGICGRFGGDEFVLFLREVDNLAEIEKQIEDFREKFSQVAFGKNADIYSTISIGVSYSDGMKVSYEAMLSCADEALMKTKEYGKNKVTFFEMKKGTIRYE